MDVNTRLTILRTLLSEEHSERKWREIQQNLVEWMLDDATDLQVGLDQVVSTLDRLSRLAELERAAAQPKEGVTFLPAQQIQPPLVIDPPQPPEVHPDLARPIWMVQPSVTTPRVTTSPNITISPSPNITIPPFPNITPVQTPPRTTFHWGSGTGYNNDEF